MMYILLAMIFGAITASIAIDRGRNVFAWFFAGVLLGPFGLAVLALPRKPKRGRYSECPACLEVVRDEAMVCRFCGTAFE